MERLELPGKRFRVGESCFEGIFEISPEIPSGSVGGPVGIVVGPVVVLLGYPNAMDERRSAVTGYPDDNGDVPVIQDACPLVLADVSATVHLFVLPEYTCKALLTISCALQTRQRRGAHRPDTRIKGQRE